MENVSISAKSNLQLAQEGFANFAKGNIKDIINQCSDDVVWATYKNPDAEPSGKFYGKEGVQEYFSKLAENVQFLSFEPKEYIVQGDTVVVLGHQKAVVKQTGKTFEHDWCMVFKLRDGKTQNCFMFLDSRDIAQASR